MKKYRIVKNWTEVTEPATGWVTKKDEYYTVECRDFWDFMLGMWNPIISSDIKDVYYDLKSAEEDLVKHINKKRMKVKYKEEVMATY